MEVNVCEVFPCFKTLDSVNQLLNSPFSESADVFKQMRKRSKMCIDVEALL